MNTNRKRFAFIATATAAVLVGGGVAVAFWTSTGTGQGNGSVGHETAFTVTQTSNISGLVPGGPAEDLNFNVNNPAGAGVQQVSSVSITLGVSPIVAGTCTTGDFTLTQPTISPTSINPGASASFVSNGATIKMKDTGVNQDGCKDATLTFTYNAS